MLPIMTLMYWLSTERKIYELFECKCDFTFMNCFNVSVRYILENKATFIKVLEY